MDPGTFDTIAESEKGIILHEFSYTLGLMHGHQSPVRGGTITLKESGTYPCSILKSILMYVHGLLVKILVMMSFSQVLHARCYERTEHRNQPNNVLSGTDKAFMRINYPNLSSHLPAEARQHLDRGPRTRRCWC
jgi:hypothetical protein